MLRSTRVVPVEVPVAISFLGIGYAVMMATPCDLEDFAVGFARSERLIDDAGDVIAIDVSARRTMAFCSASSCATERHDRLLERVRHRVGESSCGLCGDRESGAGAAAVAAASPAPPRIAPAATLPGAGLRSARTSRSTLETGAVHAAAFFDADGKLVAAREDVGRHNAFDKLIGHAMRTGVDLAAGFALLTARCSYELVEKAALAGIPLLVTVSAPTDLAVKRAEEAGLTLVALARPDSMLVMSDPHGVFAR